MPLNNLKDKEKEALELYCALLRKWQSKINLVSPKTLDDAWNRHIMDSVQLRPHIPDTTKTLVDLGSGAGFPGLVLAILRPDINVHLVESDQKKCSFLKAVSRETNIPITIHNARIDSVYGDIAPDVITARALSALPSLFEYCLPWAEKNDDLTMVFPKGVQVEDEIADAQKSYSFTYEQHKSIVDSDSAILCIRNLKCV